MTTGNSVEDILSSIPSTDPGPALETWFSERREFLARLRASPELEATLHPIELGAHVSAPASPFGRYANPLWRKLTLATFLADWACYPAPVDQVSFDRLLYVMHVFPAGFRSWWVQAPRAGWLPVGYTGWYPISAVTFDTLAMNSATLRDRSITPLPTLDPAGSFLYLFNYSIVGALRGTVCSRRLVHGLAADIQAVRPKGLAAITVSAEGIRVAERFGMRRSGTLVIDGTEEAVYTGP